MFALRRNVSTDPKCRNHWPCSKNLHSFWGAYKIIWIFYVPQIDTVGGVDCIQVSEDNMAEN